MYRLEKGNLGAPMNDVVIEVTDPDTLLAEVRRLRSEIAQLHERVELLDRLAYQDVLIDLPNRRGFLHQLEGAIDRVSRYDDSAAMLFVDIDGLKMINDTFGHQAGDEALIQVADMLSRGRSQERLRGAARRRRVRHPARARERGHAHRKRPTGWCR